MWTDLHLSSMEHKWKLRYEAVHYLNERVLYVTPAEYREIFEMQDQRELRDPPEVVQARKLREEIEARIFGGTLRWFTALDIVIDGPEAVKQQARFAGGQMADRLDRGSLRL